MVELNGVRGKLVLGVLHGDQEGAVVMEGGADGETILKAEVPRRMLAGFGMN